MVLISSRTGRLLSSWGPKLKASQGGSGCEHVFVGGQAATQYIPVLLACLDELRQALELHPANRRLGIELLEVEAQIAVGELVGGTFGQLTQLPAEALVKVLATPLNHQQSRRPKGDIAHVQVIAGEVFLNHVPLIAAADHKLVDAMGGVDLKNAPEDWHATDLHHRLLLEVDFFTDASIKPAGENCGFPGSGETSKGLK